MTKTSCNCKRIPINNCKTLAFSFLVAQSSSKLIYDSGIPITLPTRQHHQGKLTTKTDQNSLHLAKSECFNAHLKNQLYTKQPLLLSLSQKQLFVCCCHLEFVKRSVLSLENKDPSVYGSTDLNKCMNFFVPPKKMLAKDVWSILTTYQRMRCMHKQDQLVCSNNEGCINLSRLTVLFV